MPYVLRLLVAASAAAVVLSAGRLDARAQAWSQPAGHVYAKLSHGRSTAAEQFTFDGRLIPYSEDVAGDAFFDRSYYLYVEYGLTPRLTLVGLLPYKQLTVRDDRFDYTTGAIGSVQLGIRQDLEKALGLDGSQASAAVQIMAAVPAGYTRNLAPAAGTGQADVQAAFHYGLSLYPVPAYAQAGLGYRMRTSLYAFSRAVACAPANGLSCTDNHKPDYDDEWIFSAEFGVSLGRYALLQALGSGVWSNLPPETGFDPLQPTPTRQRYLKVGGGLTVYPLPSVGVSVQYFTTPTGRNTIHATDLFLGIEYRSR